MMKILIIDDDPTIQVVLRRILAPEGYNILIASSGEEGVQIAHEEKPALIICDWKMPGITGLDVCNKIKSNPQLSTSFFILLTSADSTEENKVIGLDAGCDDFLSKTVMHKHHELKARVRSALRVYCLHQELQLEKQHLEKELEEAAEYVRSILPKPLVGKNTKIEAQFIPSRQLGGDSFDYYWLDKDNLAIYLIDVSGHGLKAAFPSLSLLNLLRSRNLNQVNFYRPKEVLAGLNRTFFMTQNHDYYYTIWYGVYNLKRNRLVYSSAGHPPAVLIYRDSRGIPTEVSLNVKSFPIGLFEKADYQETSCPIIPNSRLYVFSDGIYEIETSYGIVWGMQNFIDTLKNHYQYQDHLDELLAKVSEINRYRDFADDLSIIQVDFS